MKELVPELHDVLKLIKLRFSGDAHDIHAWDSRDYDKFEPFLHANTDTWKGIRQHHLRFTEYPSDADTFYLCVADSLASHVSRVGEAGRIEHKLDKLWRPAAEERDVRLKRDNEIAALLKFLQADPTWEEFLHKYETLLRGRPEDFHHGYNITSVYTHSRLTGQFYRVLRTNPQCFPLSPNEIQGKTQAQVQALYQKKWNSEWKLTIARCKLHLLQRPFRAKDLNIFGALEELGGEISSRYRDNLLLETSDELLMLLADESQLLDIAEAAHRKGLWVEVVKARRALNELKPPDPEAMPGRKHENLYNLPSQISPPICEICQSAKATKRWPEDDILNRRQLCPTCRALLTQNPLASVAESLCEADRAKLDDVTAEPTTEEICEICFSTRCRETKLPKLANQWGREAKVAWLKLNLDFDELERTLERLSGKGGISPCVVAEFHDDYSQFLGEFSAQIQHTFGAQNVENVLSDFFCVRVESVRESLRIFQVCHRLLEKFFPAFLGSQSSPIKIAAVCANAKFPFFQAWNTLQAAGHDIFVSIQGGRVLRAPIAALGPLIEAANARYRKSALYKLARIEETSKALAELVFQNRGDEDSAIYSRLAKTLRPRLDFSSIFTFARLMQD